MERGDTVLLSKKAGRSPALNDNEHQDEEEYGEEEEIAMHELDITNENKDKFNMKFLDGNLE